MSFILMSYFILFYFILMLQYNYLLLLFSVRHVITRRYRGSGDNSIKRKGKDKDTSNTFDLNTQKLLVCIDMHVEIYYVQHDALFFIYHILMEIKFFTGKNSQ